MAPRSTALPPAWVQDAIFYQIFPDRFARSRHAPASSNLEAWDLPPTAQGFKGGDLSGIRERLGYLRQLGVTAIWMNPIFQSTANHRYHTHDYHHIDPLLGGDEAFDALLATAHRRSMRVILDGVFNHASRGLLQFNHILENGAASPFLDWFMVRELPLNAYQPRARPNYEAWWNLPALPKFNVKNQRVREFLLGVAEHWTRRGADGWRLDVPQEIDVPGFWEEFRRRVRAIRRDSYLVAEIWGDAGQALDGSTFDAAMNYPLYRAVLGFFGGTDLDGSLRPGGFELHPLDGVSFADEIDRLLGRLRPEIASSQLNLLGSHDTPRCITMMSGATRRKRLAMLFLMTFQGAPCIYYGDEISMEGREDPDCRRAFPVELDRKQQEELDWTRRCIALRTRHPALRRGRYIRLHASNDCFVFARRDKSDTVVAAFNRHKTSQTIRIPLARAAEKGRRWYRALDSGPIQCRDQMLELDLPPISGTVLVAQKPSSRRA